jgi:hypothetical protein
MNAPALQLNVALLPEPARKDFTFWRGHIEPLLDKRGGILRTLDTLAVQLGIPAKTVRKKYYAAKNGGLLALVDKRLAGPRWWKTKESVGLSTEDQELVKLYCEQNQRSSKSAIKQLRRDFLAGKVKTKTPLDSRTRMPRGWSARNLMRAVPTKFELKSIRIGRTAAASERALVYTTRKGLWVGSHYMLDDMWHDLFVNTFAENQAGRPLELFSHDLFSARKVRWGVRVRTRDVKGKYNQLTEGMTRMVLAATLHLDGYSPRGTMIVAEHGTAAVSEQIERDLRDLTMRDGTPLITVKRSGMTGAAAHAGQYPGLSRGNFRFKASLESSNNLTHNVFAALPGQTGKDVEHRPEQLDGLLDHNRDLLIARGYLPPERAAKLQFPLLELGEFHRAAADLYAAMESDADHELSDWLECGHVTQELLIGGHWVNREELLKHPAQAELAAQLIASGHLEARPRKLSRREVWDQGAGELIKLPGHGVCAILGDDLARERRVRGERFEFADAEVGPGLHRYESVCLTPYGERLRLREGEIYQTFVNPFAPGTLFVRRADGSYLGECARTDAPCRGDVEAVERRMGAVAKEEKELLAPLRQRHLREARDKATRHENNRDVLGGNTPADRAERERLAEESSPISDFLAPEAEPGESRPEPLSPSAFL